MRQGKKKVGIVFMFLGCIEMIVGGIFFSVYLDKEERCTQLVDAVVMDLATKGDYDDDDMSYAPVFLYEYENALYSSQHEIYTNPCSYEIGDDVELLIDPNEPEDFIIKGSIWMQLIGGIFLGLGVVFLIISLLLIARAKKTKTVKREYITVKAGTYNLNGIIHRGSDLDDSNGFVLNGTFYNRHDRID